MSAAVWLWVSVLLPLPLHACIVSSCTTALICKQFLCLRWIMEMKFYWACKATEFPLFYPSCSSTTRSSEQSRRTKKRIPFEIFWKLVFCAVVLFVNIAGKCFPHLEALCWTYCHHMCFCDVSLRKERVLLWVCGCISSGYFNLNDDVNVEFHLSENGDFGQLEFTAITADSDRD